MERRSKRARIYVFTWLIHFVVQQKLTQHCKAIIKYITPIKIILKKNLPITWALEDTSGKVDILQ